MKNESLLRHFRSYGFLFFLQRLHLLTLTEKILDCLDSFSAKLEPSDGSARSSHKLLFTAVRQENFADGSLASVRDPMLSSCNTSNR